MSLQPCCFNSGSAPKLGNGPVCSGRVGMFQRNSDQNVAACFQSDCSATSGPQPSLAYTGLYTVYCACMCVRGPAGYCKSSSLFSFS